MLFQVKPTTGRLSRRILTLLTLASLTFSQLAFPSSLLQAEEVETPAISTLGEWDVHTLSPRESLFHYANYAWLLDHPLDTETMDSYSMMDTVSIRNQRLVEQDIADLLSGEIPAETKELKEFVKLQKLLADSERRETEGLSPLAEQLAALNNLSSLEAFNQQFVKLAQAGYSLPANLAVVANPEQVTTNMVELSEPSVFFAVKEVYDDQEQLDRATEDFRITGEALFQAAGYSPEEAKEHVTKALDFDRAIAHYLLPAEEAAKSTSFYNPKTLEEVAAFSKHLDFKAIIKGLTSEKVTTVNVTNLTYFEQIDKLVNPDTLPQIQSWLLYHLLNDAAPYLNQEMQAALYASQASESPQEDTPPPSPEDIQAANQEQATYLASQEFDQVIGQFFAQRHLSKAAKEAVTSMTKDIIQAYKNRLKKNKWLSSKTRQAAIEKLDKLTLHIGAPDKLPALYSKKVVDDKLSAYANIRHFTQLAIKENWEQLGKQTDSSDWGFPAHEVNAFYSPQANAVYLPAGFLQAPIYDEANTISANYGAIGTVIGHEITHAFDSDGALYDADGNLHNWWTEKDFQAFEKKTQEMIDLWEGMPYATGEVNGELTVTENIADLGGMAVALDSLKKQKQADVRDFFISYARLWSQVATDDYYLDQMATDSHSPNELRANVVPTQFGEFHDLFDTKKGDPMYRSPKDRLEIW